MIDLDRMFYNYSSAVINLRSWHGGGTIGLWSEALIAYLGKSPQSAQHWAPLALLDLSHASNTIVESRKIDLEFSKCIYICLDAAYFRLVWPAISVKAQVRDVRFALSKRSVFLAWRWSNNSSHWQENWSLVQIHSWNWWLSVWSLMLKRVYRGAKFMSSFVSSYRRRITVAAMACSWCTRSWIFEDWNQIRNAL